MPDLLSTLLGQWEEPEVIELLPVESLPQAVAPEPVTLLNIEALLDSWDEEKQEIAAEPTPDAVPEPVRLARATDVEVKHRYIKFWMADEAYAVPIAQVIESDKLAEVTPLPRVNEAIRGLIHLRGEILPMVDLRLILGSKSSEADERMLIVRTKNSSGACGIAVDRVSGLIAIRPHEVEQCAGNENQFVSSICDRQGSRIRLLELDRMFEGLSNPLAVREHNV